MTPDQVDALVASFDWANTSNLQETDENGFPTFFSARIVLDSRDQIELLDISRITYDYSPLFPSERQYLDAYPSGHLEPGASTDGTKFVVYALVPGAYFNEARRLALGGDPPFVGIALTTTLEPGATTPSGYLDLDWLIQNGCTFGLTDAELSIAATGPTPQPLFGRLVRALVRIGRGIVNAVRTVVAAFKLKRDFQMRMRVVDLDEHFRDPAAVEGTPSFDRNVVRRAWGPDANKPIVPHGARIVAERVKARESEQPDRMMCWRRSSRPFGSPALGLPA